MDRRRALAALAGLGAAVAMPLRKLPAAAVTEPEHGFKRVTLHTHRLKGVFYTTPELMADSAAMDRFLERECDAHQA